MARRGSRRLTTTRGKLAVNVADLSTFEPILRAAGNETKLAGALAIDWEGQRRDLPTFKNTGNLKLTLENGRFAELDKLEATIDANYSPRGIERPDRLHRERQADVPDHHAGEGRDAGGEQGADRSGRQRNIAAGYVSVPFVWENLGTDKPLFASDGKVVVNFQTENLDIEEAGERYRHDGAGFGFGERETRCARHARRFARDV